MLQLKNNSPFKPAIAVMPNPDGIDTLYIVVKGTFLLRPHVSLADLGTAPTLTDVYWGDPETSSLKYAAELHVGKAGTDVVLVGQAWASDGRATPTGGAMVEVAERRKIVRVTGDRVWRSGTSFTAPEPFVSMPLVYERAFGGTQVLDEQRRLAEERNPVGVGFLGKQSRADLVGQKLPNIEDPRQSIESLGDTPAPAGFGFVGPAWLPRRRFAGTYDKAWQKQRAPYLPRDFDLRFFNAAPPELTFDRFLAGGEAVHLAGVSPEGPIRFVLPRCRPVAAVTVAGAHEKPSFDLETVVLEPDLNRICLTWRAAQLCDKTVLKVESVTIDVNGLDVPAK
jgi:hypothetical protein